VSVQLELDLGRANGFYEMKFENQRGARPAHRRGEVGGTTPQRPGQPSPASAASPEPPAAPLEATWPLEAQARAAWRRDAVDWKYRRCDTCGDVRDAEGKLVLAVKQPGSRIFECLPCWDGTR
jgi:hypothetical protein